MQVEEEEQAASEYMVTGETSTAAKKNKMEETNFCPHGTGLGDQTARFTNVKENIILKVQSEFMNGSDFARKS